MWLRWLLMLALSSAIRTAPMEQFIEYNEPRVELVFQRSGHDIKLQCELGELEHDVTAADTQFKWFFKQCGESQAVACQHFAEDQWTHLPCEENFCHSSLHLRNITDKYSGLYKCLRLPDTKGGAPETGQVRVYQLDVREPDHFAAEPEFVDSAPSNQTAVVGAQVVFQCRVHSSVHPSIKWFHRLVPELHDKLALSLGPENFNSHIVRYNGFTYELMPSSPEKQIGDNVYLSKLLLADVHLLHAGFYACVAVNYGGHRIREAHLEVVTLVPEDKDYWADYEEESPPTSPKQFVLLFLMPLGLALLPATLWLGYLLFKRHRSQGHRHHKGEPHLFGEEPKSMLRDV